MIHVHLITKEGSNIQMTAGDEITIYHNLYILKKCDNLGFTHQSDGHEGRKKHNSQHGGLMG